MSFIVHLLSFNGFKVAAPARYGGAKKGMTVEEALTTETIKRVIRHAFKSDNFIVILDVKSIANVEIVVHYSTSFLSMNR